MSDVGAAQQYSGGGEEDNERPAGPSHGPEPGATHEDTGQQRPGHLGREDLQVRPYPVFVVFNV